MTQDLINFIVFLVACFGLSILLYVSKKINLTKQDTDLSEIALNLAIIVTKESNIHIKDNIVMVLQNILQTVKILEDYNNVHNEEDKIKFITENASMLCLKNGIEVNEDFKKRLNDLVVFLIVNGYVKV